MHYADVVRRLDGLWKLSVSRCLTPVTTQVRSTRNPLSQDWESISVTIQNKSELVRIASRLFPYFSPTDVEFLTAVEEGTLFDRDKQLVTDPASSNEVDKSKSHAFKANLLIWVCTNKKAVSLVTRHGIRLEGATIDGKLDLSSIRVPFPLVLKNCFLDKGVKLRNAYIAELDMTGTQAAKVDAKALHVDGDIVLKNGFQAKGPVILAGATIGGNLDFTNAILTSGDRGNALDCETVTVKGSVYLHNGFRAKGSVGFVDATIKGNLECNNGEFINLDGKALDCERLNAGGDVFFSKRKGQRSDDPNMKGKSFEAQGTVSFVCAEIRGHFSWQDVNSSDKVTLDLRYAKVGIYRDDKESWPTEGKLRLEGFHYESIEESDPSEIRDRVEWLSRQYPKKGKKSFYPQPYEQLADVFKRIGDDKAAKKILIEKNRERSRKANLSLSEKFWYRFFGKIIGYGYTPWGSLIVMLLLIILGWYVFCMANANGLMTPTDARAIANTKQQISKDYPVFNALVYSIDTFVPLVDLGVSKYYLPNANRKKPVPPTKFFALFVNGSYIRIYLWFHIAAGWILTSLLVVGITALVRK